MGATDFEFENRFWAIGVIFFLGFWIPPFFHIDQTNFVEGAVRFLRPGVNPESPEYRHTLQAIFAGGAVLVFFAAWLRTWATAYLKARVVHDARLHSDHLVASGPFRHLRNPLYFATLLMAAGTALLASRIGAIAIIAGMAIFLYRLILREEAGLLASQGESYRRYLDAVPRLLPSPRARVPDSAVAPQWKEAIGAELWFWLFGVATLVFALTLRLILYGAAMIIAFGSYFLFLMWMKREKEE